MPASELAATDAERFGEELRKRRDLVYEYLESWPGADNFRPHDIHEALFSYVRHRGKGLRPALLMLCAGAVGGDEMQALPAAAAVEIFQIWTLVHDDIIDRDETRRGSPTVHTLYGRLGREKYKLAPDDAAHYGVSVAVLAGDLQQSWSFALLCDLLERGVSPDLVTRLVRRMASSLTPKLLEGEMLDVQYSLNPRADLTGEDILRMLAGKTSALLEYAAWAGATVGLGARDGARQSTYPDSLGRFAGLCGTAFQLQDDLLGLTADEAVLGKPVGSDVREGKRTLLVHYALETATEEERGHIQFALGNKVATGKQTTLAIDIILRSGAAERVRKLADLYIGQALNILDVLPESEPKGLLRLWAAFLLARRN
ncbi:MAG: polyprenyl synthetase family protein [Chloroflexota bacterium]